MNGGQLQEWLDRVSVTSWQRWALIALATMSAFAASTISSVVEGHQTTGVIVLIVFCAVASALRADTHVAVVTEVLVVWQWLVSADDVTTAWSIAVASCLLLFHGTVAVMAVTPITAVVDTPLVLDWGRRMALIVGATVAVWALVLLLDRGEVPGRPALTAIAFVVLTALVLVAARRATATNGQPDTR